MYSHCGCGIDIVWIDAVYLQSRKAICRVCLEEDSIVNLTQPCSCSGSMQHIHTDCLQSWISEKRSKSCEICWQEYQGSYRLPSPGQSAQPSSVQLIFPLQRPGVIVRVDQSTRTINFDYPPVSVITFCCYAVCACTFAT
ncbi:TPA: hypothetical protein ACH3X2_011959 [Trebouxia sp. C0005]